MFRERKKLAQSHRDIFETICLLGEGARNEEIEIKSGWSKRVVQRSIAELCEMGALEYRGINQLRRLIPCPDLDQAVQNFIKS